MRKYLANRKKNLRLAWTKTRATLAEILKVLLKVGRAMNTFYGQGTIFIGEEGALSRTGLDSTVAGSMEDACPLRRSEGDVFTRVHRFSWKRIVGVNPLP
jgi:hypothetical protein